MNKVYILLLAVVFCICAASVESARYYSRIPPRSESRRYRNLSDTSGGVCYNSCRRSCYAGPNQCDSRCQRIDSCCNSCGPGVQGDSCKQRCLNTDAFEEFADAFDQCDYQCRGAAPKFRCLDKCHNSPCAKCQPGNAACLRKYCV
jgi:hypothetical protein